MRRMLPRWSARSMTWIAGSVVVTIGGVSLASAQTIRRYITERNQDSVEEKVEEQRTDSMGTITETITTTTTTVAETTDEPAGDERSTSTTRVTEQDTRNHSPVEVRVFSSGEGTDQAVRGTVERSSSSSQHSTHYTNESRNERTGSDSRNISEQSTTISENTDVRNRSESRTRLNVRMNTGGNRINRNTDGEGVTSGDVNVTFEIDGN
jgi:hypothetical protein